MRATKPSGIEWAAELPLEWQVKSLFAIGRESRIPNSGGKQDNLLSLSFGEVVEKDINSSDGLLPESFDTYQVIKPNDLVFRFTDLQNDKRSLRSALNKHTGIITSAYMAFSPRDCVPQFLAYLMRSYDLTKVFYAMGSGLRQSLKYSDVKRLPIILPPIDEQKAIADFLDRETAQIDNLIAKQEQLIVSTAERRQALISKSVTKGLVPSVSMKFSGNDWLGEIPEHWEMKPLARLALLNPESLGESTDGDLEIQYVEISDVNRESGVSKSTGYRFADAPSRARRLVKDGDVLVSTVRTYLRAIGKISDMDVEQVLVASTGFAVLRSKNVDPDFLVFALMAEHFVSRVEAESVGVSYPGINASTLMHFQLPIPPHGEQIEISRHLIVELRTLDELTEKIKKTVSVLGERRQALISSAVTGKISVGA